MQARPAPIEDYGLIGNAVSAALVSRDGSMDWLCLPRFDSPACFASLIGTPDHGRWQIRARNTRKRSRRYRPDTAILETRFETPTGIATLIDFMPPTDDESKVDVVRIVRGNAGRVAIDMDLTIRFNYGSAVPWVRRRDYGLSAVAGPDAVELHTPVALAGHDLQTTAALEVREGGHIPFTLSYHRAHVEPHFIRDSRENLGLTEQFWRNWIEPFQRLNCPARWNDALIRSLVTLKLLTYKPTGGIIAAPTASLPETWGGARNWDYRYCWLRDSALTLYALVNAGFRAEASAWRTWLLRAVAGNPDDLQIMYGPAGERWLDERELPWLPGHGGARPVRVGNAAAGQLQLDVFGELMDTLHAAREAGLPSASDAWDLEVVLLERLETLWRNNDRGIWEIRGEPRAFTHSRVMCWAAFDRAMLSSRRFGLRAPVARWRRVRDTIRRQIMTLGIDGRGRFVQHYGGSNLDASLLLLVQLGFVDSANPVFLRTLAGIEEELMEDGFVRRYEPEHTDDGFAGEPEGMFLPCNFWLADAYVMTGRFDDAETMFNRLLDIRNDLGLLGEEYDPASGRLLGNFPQAFSHVGLINTALNLIKRHGPAHQRAAKTASPASPKEKGVKNTTRPDPSVRA